MATIKVLTELCRSLRDVFGTEDLIIAGGAPRDILNGTKIKDIDVFVRIDTDGPTDWFVTRANRFAEQYGATCELRGSAPEYGDIFDLADITLPIGGVIQIIGGVIQIIGLWEECPIDDVHKYDFGLSQVFVTPAGVFATERYYEDHYNHTITYIPGNRNAHSDQRSKARLARLREKYLPLGWRFVGCDVLDELDDLSSRELV